MLGPLVVLNRAMERLSISILVLAAMFNGGCAKTECGAGTHLDGNACVAASTITCGTGTTEMMGMCTAAAPVTCGAGTTLEGNMCVDHPSAQSCGLGTVERGSECVEGALQYLHLPFAAGTHAVVGQGMHGNFSHFGAAVNAIDFTVDEGTMIVAASAGRVSAVREDSNTGCGDSSCANDGNFVVVDQGDGTRIEYYHLQQNGALVEVGDIVCAGEPIGLSGNTGFSSAPHLHLDAIDALGYTLPIYFEEVGAVGDGIAFAGIDFVSDNAAPATCDVTPEYSECLADTFAPWGVWLDPGAPCTFALHDHDYTFSGTSYGPTTNILLGRFREDTQAWTYDCVTTDSSGHFSTTIRFDSAMYPTRAPFMLAAADETCTSYSGWDVSVGLRF